MNIHKTFRLGPLNITISKSGISFSVGAGGLRFKRSADGRKLLSFRKAFIYIRKWFG